uniref:Uncharacterized protein n=1 Tax=Coccidioides posadasii RMSCC 3488 TaxID=454284 RepID=A0A0J6ICN6_COCPO|nr:hypothetical protein CPAG_05778 [Coccidioides posadasii RMSCC 3488]
MSRRAWVDTQISLKPGRWANFRVIESIRSASLKLRSVLVCSHLCKLCASCKPGRLVVMLAANRMWQSREHHLTSSNDSLPAG